MCGLWEHMVNGAVDGRRVAILISVILVCDCSIAGSGRSSAAGDDRTGPKIEKKRFIEQGSDETRERGNGTAAQLVLFLLATNNQACFRPSTVAQQDGRSIHN